MPKAITLKDIAQIEGVSTQTVSLALRDHHSISQETRIRIQNRARLMGYQANDQLRALVKLRQSSPLTSTPKSIHTLYLGHQEDQFLTQEKSQVIDHAIQKRASELGYEHQKLFIPESQPLEKTLQHLSPDGLLLISQTPIGKRCLPPSFPCPAVAYLSRQEPRLLHEVVYSMFDSMLLLMQELKNRDYHSPILWLSEKLRPSVQIRLQQAFLAYQKKFTTPLTLRLIDPEQEQTKFLQEALEAQHDVIICRGGRKLLKAAHALGIQIPQTIGVAALDVPDLTGHTSGLYRNRPLAAERTVEFLHQLISTYQKDLPQHPSQLVLQPQWLEGRTLRASSSSH